MKVKSDSLKGVDSVCRGIEEAMEIMRAEGKAEGEARLSSLINILCSKQQFEEIQKVTTDVELRNQYYLKYNL